MILLETGQADIQNQADKVLPKLSNKPKESLSERISTDLGNTGRGIMQGGVYVADTAKLISGLGAKVSTKPFEFIANQTGITDRKIAEEIQYEVFKAGDALTQPAKEHWEADKGGTIVGTIGNQLGTVVIPAVIAGPYGIGATQTVKGVDDAKKLGASDEAANTIGAIQGAAMGAGAGIPMIFSGSLRKKIVKGAAANIGLGITANTASKAAAINIDAGNTKLRKAYENTPTSIAIDGIFGVAPPLASAAKRKAQQVVFSREDKDVLSVELSKQHLDDITNIAATPNSKAQMVTGIDEALNALNRGRNDNPSRKVNQPYARPDLPEFKPVKTPRFKATTRLESIPTAERKKLKYDAPELNEYAAFIEQKYNLPTGLLNAIKNAGERSNSWQTSPAGAKGVMQFMPSNVNKFGVKDVTDPMDLMDAAGRYFVATSKQYDGNVAAMIADYNGGPRQANRVLKGQQPKAKETRDYLKRVQDFMRTSQAPRKRMYHEDGASESYIYDVVEFDSITPFATQARNADAEAAYQRQIDEIANDLDLSRLTESTRFNEGAPFINRRAEIENGNVRAAAINRAYDNGTADGYRAHVRDNAAMYGIDHQRVDGMSKPILVRQRDGDDSAAFRERTNTQEVPRQATQPNAGLTFDREAQYRQMLDELPDDVESALNTSGVNIEVPVEVGEKMEFRSMASVLEDVKADEASVREQQSMIETAIACQIQRGAA